MATKKKETKKRRKRKAVTDWSLGQPLDFPRRKKPNAIVEKIAQALTSRN